MKFFLTERKMATLKFLLLLTCHLIVHTTSNDAVDTVDVSHPIKDGETIVSSNGRYELGFFSPGSSTNRYVGIWFKTIPNRTVIWVANREVPLPNRAGVFKVTQPGILALLNGTNGTVWSSSNATRPVKNPVAQLLDSANLVVKDGDGNHLWESFDHPGDTFISGMKFGKNLVTGLEIFHTSWKSTNDPAPGDYTHYVDLTGYPQTYMKKNGVIQSRRGPWNGLPIRWKTDPFGDSAVNLVTVMNQTEVSLTAESRSVVFRFRLSDSGNVQLFIWIDRRQEWSTYQVTPIDDCDRYGLCGAYGLCDSAASPLCGCLDGFEPKNPKDWGKTDWSGGCIRKINMSCEGDGFLKRSGLKLPDARNSQHREGLPLEECRAECLRNCSCIAYSLLNMSSRTGCLFWFEGLVDMRNDGLRGFDIYLRVSASELDSGKRKQAIIIGSLASGIGMVLLVLTLFLLYIRKRKNKSKSKKEGNCGGGDLEVPFFNYSDILKATDHFSFTNKLGEGGFGTVFKGTLKDGQEIAVKCLSKTSMQGIDEFKNEVNFIAKLQHRNLIRILGCCIQENQNMLIYEYMHHKSLDVILFDQTKKASLDWPKRFHVINGVARGLSYLHHDSRLRVIHRDLKAGNILLDSDLNPKISDFGTARSFKETEIATMTKRVIGTRGYMSPEYAVDGLFSVKSDVFSFGVLVLEIVSGKKNREFSHSDHFLNLLGHAWTLYQEGRPLDLVDTSLAGVSDMHEILRSIHIGLLCVQKRLEDRPTMSSVVHMLRNEGVLPLPNQPGFFIERDIINDRLFTNTIDSINEATITMPEGR